jgi:hypothetical protein
VHYSRVLHLIHGISKMGVTLDEGTMWLVGITSMLSFCGAAFVIITYMLGRRRHFILRLIVSLAVANLLTAVSYLMSFVEWRFVPSPGDAWCPTQAMLMVVFEDASILWTVAIALTLHQQTVARRKPERLEHWFHIVCWGVPSMVAVVLLLLGMLGPADPAPHQTWCWIAAELPNSNHSQSGDEALLTSVEFSTSSARAAQLGVFYVPLAFAFVFNLAMYFQVGRAFTKMAYDGAVDAANEQQIQVRLRLYLLVFLVIWAPPLAHRTAQAFGYDPVWLRLLHTVSSCSMGALNCLVYGCNEATLRPYKEALQSLGCSRFGIRLALGRRPRPMAATTVLGGSSRVDDTLLLDATEQSNHVGPT